MRLLSTILLLVCLSVGAQTNSVIQTNALPLVTLSWQYPVNAFPDDSLAFILSRATNVSADASNWLCWTLWPSNCISGTNGDYVQFTNQFRIKPGQYFWVIRASNFWGAYGVISPPSDIISTPPVPTQTTNESISKP
jgi:hypothetical protein